MRPSTAGRRYAEAAFEVAREDGDTRRWLSDLEVAAEALSDPRVEPFFRDPDEPRERKLQALADMFPNFPPHVLNLLRTLASRDRLSLLRPIVREFRELDRRARGVLEAHVTVARPLSDQERADVARRLEEATGKRVDLEAEVNPAILGGIVVRIGDRLIDASVAGRLERLRHEMAV